MANNHTGRLNRLAQLYGTTRLDERARLAEIYEDYRELEQQERWPEGTADAILEALMTDRAHTFTYYDEDGNRTVYRIGPFCRDERGRVRWDWYPACAWKHERLEFQPSHADGLLKVGAVSTHLPDGSYFDMRRVRPEQVPTAQHLRAMVVDRARRLGELEDLERGVNMDAAAWVRAGEDESTWATTTNRRTAPQIRTTTSRT